MNNCIELSGIIKQFKDVTVLKDINLKIGYGEVFGLLGPSGAGKTTLIKILTGQLKANAGTAAVLGQEIGGDGRELYTYMGMVLDNTGLYDRLSCYDNLALFADIFGIPKHKIQTVLEQVGLRDSIKRPVQKLSKGMKQRLAFARALLHDPKLLFLDEPTSGLDPATAAGIHRLILERKESGTTVFLTTHNMEEAAKLCDHVALLNEGHIVEYGSPKELCLKYNHKKQIQIVLKNGRQLSFPCLPESAEPVEELIKNNDVVTIHSTEPDLETVFMELTGRKLVQDEI